MDDNEIIRLYWQRSESAISETAVRYGRLIYHVASHILRSPEDIEECVNDTYLGAWQAIPPAKPQILSSFLCRISRNLAITKHDYIPAAKRNPSVSISLPELEDVLAADDSIDDRYSDEELADCINQFHETLNLDQRNVFIRRYWYFESIKEIMMRYKMSQSKVESMLFRTRGKLRLYLEKRGYSDESK